MTEAETSIGIFFTGKDCVEVIEGPMPQPGPGQVLVKASKSLISTGTECICLQRKFAPGTHWDQWVKYPFAAGYSLAGRVVKVGEGVTDLKIGDRVAGLAPHATFALLPTSIAFPVPDEVSDEEATWSVLAYVVQHGFRKPRVQLGETVIVVGLGLLGQLCVQYARVAGARCVIAIDPARRRLEWAASHGATHTIDRPVDETVEQVASITGGRMAEVVFDMTGHPAVFASCLKLLAKQGRLGLIGDTGTPAEQRLGSEVITRDLTIFGAHGPRCSNEPTEYAPWTKARSAELFFDLLVQRRMRVSDLVTHRFPVREATEAYRLLTTRRDEAMGVILDFGGA